MTLRPACLSFREIYKSIAFETVAQREPDICITLFLVWLWRFGRGICRDWLRSRRELAACERERLQEHLKLASSLHSDTQPKTRRPQNYRWALRSTIRQLISPASFGWRLHPGTRQRCSRRGTERGPLGTGRSEWAHLCFLLLGSGRAGLVTLGDGEKVATPEHQATSGCQRPRAITKTCLQPCLATAMALSGHFCQRAWIAFSLVAQISVVRLTTLFYQPPMNGRIDKVGGSASQSICLSVILRSTRCWHTNPSTSAVPQGRFRLDSWAANVGAVPCNAIDKKKTDLVHLALLIPKFIA